MEERGNPVHISALPQGPPRPGPVRVQPVRGRPGLPARHRTAGGQAHLMQAPVPWPRAGTSSSV